MGDVFNSNLADKSFHGGGGMEIYLGGHFAINAEFLMVVPEVSKVVVSKHPLRVDTTGDVNWSKAVSPDPTDYISGSNFQASIGLKYYF